MQPGTPIGLFDIVKQHCAWPDRPCGKLAVRATRQRHRYRSAMIGWLTSWFKDPPPPVAAELSAEAAEDGRALAAAPVHVLRDDGLVRLIDGHLAFTATGEREERIRLNEVSQLSLFGTAGVTSPCLRELMRRGIPVMFRSPGGHYVGQTTDLSGQLSVVRRAQYRAVEDRARSLVIARTLIHAKIVNARGLVRRNAARPADTLRSLELLARHCNRARDPGELLGIEGAAAAAFYSALPALIAPERRADFPWDGRRRRPPTNSLNALLSYLYAVVAGECACAALAAGLDPTVGFLHVERPGRPALALDLAEPFRPLLADGVALAVINRGEAKPDHFAKDGDSIRLNETGRRIVLGGLERRFASTVPSVGFRETPKTWREAVFLQARTLAAALRHDKAFACIERG